jgi:endoglucanase
MRPARDSGLFAPWTGLAAERTGAGRPLPVFWRTLRDALLLALWAALGLAAALLLATGPLRAAELHRGINITNWFRFPASTDPAALRRYLPASALSELHRSGFDFVRLAIDPAVVEAPPQRAVLLAAIRRIEHEGMAVVVSIHPTAWRLESSAADRVALQRFWRDLGADLADLDQTLTVPEILNEPVFTAAPADWAALQHAILVSLRQRLPRATIVLTGTDWSSIKGLLALTPEADPNVLYGFHFYDPAELTALAPWRSDVDRAALSRLPFPGTGGCSAGHRDGPTADLVQYYCASGWDGAAVRRDIDRAAAWAAANHVRLFTGEFGATAELNAAARLAWIASVRAALAADGIPWAFWGLEDVMGFNLPRPPGADPVLDPALLRALGLPASL